MLCFLIKSTYLISLLYSLLVARVSGRFEAFFGELALFWCSSATRKKKVFLLAVEHVRVHVMSLGRMCVMQ